MFSWLNIAVDALKVFFGLERSIDQWQDHRVGETIQKDKDITQNLKVEQKEAQAAENAPTDKDSLEGALQRHNL